MVNANCEIPEEVIERSRVYRSSKFEKNHGGVWDSWCDGYQNKGHFIGIDTVSIMEKGVEVRLCRDCRDALFNAEALPGAAQTIVREIYEKCPEIITDPKGFLFPGGE